MNPLPPELLHAIIDHLHDDKKSLISLSLASHITLVRSRHHLFSTLVLGDNDPRFDKFLSVIDVPWTSLTLAVKRIRIKGLFNSWTYHYSRYHDVPRIARNLRFTRSLWLMPSYAWRIYWHCVPPHVLDLIFRLAADYSVSDLHVYGVVMDESRHVLDFFRRLPHPSCLESLVFYNMSGEGEVTSPLRCEDLSYFQRPFKFRVLDSCSFLLWQNVWDPLIQRNALDVRVEAFYLRSLSRGDERHVMALSKFLRLIGPTLERLSFDIADLFNVIDEKWHFLDGLDLSQCFSVHALHVGIILQDECARRSTQMFQSMWRIFSALPSPSHLRELSLAFRPTEFPYPLGSEAKDLGNFKWAELVARVRKTFRNLNKIRILVGARDFEKAGSYLEALRGPGGLASLEKEGLLKLEVFPMPVDERMLESPWRDISGLGDLEGGINVPSLAAKIRELAGSGAG